MSIEREYSAFRTNVARALGIPNSIAAQMTPEALVAEAQKLRTRLQSRPRPLATTRLGALTGYPFAEVVATCEAACAVADMWATLRPKWIGDGLLHESHAAWAKLVNALDALEVATRSSTLRKVRP